MNHLNLQQDAWACVPSVAYPWPEILTSSQAMPKQELKNDNQIVRSLLMIKATEGKFRQFPFTFVIIIFISFFSKYGFLNSSGFHWCHHRWCWNEKATEIDPPLVFR